mmetsp:Transcript_8793/g.13128  ORF Transcript_8793/g.13128 Transcript_8793/m.13128 type:complete len:301 (+) Transcript_8793:73-975(+)
MELIDFTVDPWSIAGRCVVIGLQELVLLYFLLYVNGINAKLLCVFSFVCGIVGIFYNLSIAIPSLLHNKAHFRALVATRKCLGGYIVCLICKVISHWRSLNRSSMIDGIHEVMQTLKRFVKGGFLCYAAVGISLAAICLDNFPDQIEMTEGEEALSYEDLLKVTNGMYKLSNGVLNVAVISPGLTFTAYSLWKWFSALLCGLSVEEEFCIDTRIAMTGIASVVCVNLFFVFPWLAEFLEKHEKNSSTLNKEGISVLEAWSVILLLFLSIIVSIASLTEDLNDVDRRFETKDEVKLAEQIS